MATAPQRVIGGAQDAEEYEYLMMGGASQTSGIPARSQVISHASGVELSRPFYDKGPNDKGIGIQLGCTRWRG
jgi:nitrate/nitrite transport system permease protein